MRKHLPSFASAQSAASWLTGREKLDQLGRSINVRLPRLVRKIFGLALALGLVVGLALAQQSPSQESEARSQSPRAQEFAHRFSSREGKLKTGDVAPGFDLKKLHSEEQVRLADFKNKKPVALIFGSYT